MNKYLVDNMKTQEAMDSKPENLALSYQFEALIAEFASIRENIRHFEQAGHQFLVVIGAFLAVVAAADKIFTMDIASLWAYLPIASIFISAVSMYFVLSLLAVVRSGVYIRIHLQPKMKSLLTQAGAEIDKFVIWEQFTRDFDQKLPFFIYGGLPEILLAIIPNVSIMYFYVRNRPISGFTITDALEILAVLVFIQVLITGIWAIRMSTISSEDDWNRFALLRFHKKRKQK
jgi:hypothetical protein